MLTCPRRQGCIVDGGLLRRVLLSGRTAPDQTCLLPRGEFSTAEAALQLEEDSHWKIQPAPSKLLKGYGTAQGLTGLQLFVAKLVRRPPNRTQGLPRSLPAYKARR